MSHFRLSVCRPVTRMYSVVNGELFTNLFTPLLDSLLQASGSVVRNRFSRGGGQ